MSYRFSSQLQSVLYQRLSTDRAVAELVGTAIFDEPPQQSDAIDTAYVTIGGETVRPFGSMTSVGAIHDFDVTVQSGQCGFDGAKRIGAAICEALAGYRTELADGTLVDIRFVRARAQRGRKPVKRSISLRFRAVIDGA